MRMRDELRDPWGWLLAAVAGVAGWVLLAVTQATPAPALAGVAIALVTLAGKLAIGAGRRRRAPAAAVRDRLPEPPPGSPQAALGERAAAAVTRMADLAERPADRRVASDLGSVLAGSAGVAAALEELAGRVTLLDGSIAAARPDTLANEIAALQQRMRATSDPEVRAEQERALAALDGQADAIDRLLRRRDTLLAQMQAAVGGLEELASGCAEIVALGSADTIGVEPRILAELTEGLGAVRAGVDEARRVLREL